MSLYRNISVVLTANSTGLNAGLRASAAQVERFSGQVKKSNDGLLTSKNLLRATGIGALALAGGLAYSVKQAIEFDSAMRNVNSLLHVNESQFKAMESQVIGMSRRLPQSATTLAEGLYDIASSGFAGSDAMKVLNASAQAASAGLSTTETAARAITATINAYGLSANDANDVSDTLFQTVNLGVVSFDELASSLGDVVGGAAAAHVSIDQVGSAIATMTLAGISGAESTTSLNRLLQAMIDPSDALKGALKSLGYESGAQALKVDGLHTVMDKLRVVTGGNIETLLKYFPEIRSARGALALMANEGKNYNRVSAEIENKNKRAGATVRTLAEQMKSAKNQIQLFKNEINAAAIGVGTSLLPVLLKMLHGVQLTGEEIARVSREIGTALGPTWKALGDTWANLVDLGGQLGQAIGPFAAALAHLGVGAVVLTLNAFFTLLSGITGLMADHEGIVVALGVAYGIRLAGGIGAATGAMRIASWKAFSTVLVGMLDGVDSLAGGFKALATSEAAATAGVAAGIATIVVAYGAYKSGSKNAAEGVKALKAAQDAWAKGSLPDANKNLGVARDRLAEYDALIGKVKSRGFGADLVHFADGYKLIGQSSGEMEKLRSAIVGIETAQMAANSAAMQYLSETGAQFANTDQYNAAIANIVSKAQAAGIDLSRGLGPARAALDGLGLSGVKTKEELEQGLIKAMGNVGNKATDAADAVDALKAALDALIGVALSADEANDKFEATLDDLTKTIKTNGKTLDANTEKGRANRAAIRDSVGALKDKIEADAKAGKSSGELSAELQVGIGRLRKHAESAGMSKKAMEQLLKQYNLTPALVQTIVDAVGADTSASQVAALKRQLDALHNKTVTVDIAVHTGALNKARANLQSMSASAHGNILVDHYAQGGIRALPKSAMIAKDGANLMNWAEPGTGGEAFIPLAQDRRKRSTEILARVAQQFGLSLVGDMEQAAYGAFHYPAYHVRAWHRPGRHKKESAKAYNARVAQAYKDLAAQRRQDYREYVDRRYQAAEQYRENRRLYGEAKGGGAGSVTGQGLASSSAEGLANYGTALETQRQSSAQYQANRSKNPYDSAADFYKKPVLTARGMASGLAAQTAQVKSWGGQLSKIAAGAGADVASSLERMGDQGKAAVAAMSKASVKDMRRMGEEMRKLDFANFTTTTASNAKAAAGFQANLLTLVKMGRSDLAAQFAEMGYESAGTLAAEAVKDPTTAAALAKNLGTIDQASSANLNQALTLAAILQGGGGKIGVMGLATRSGMNISDVLGLLTTFDKDVFGKMGGSMAQVRIDQGMISKGQQPSGLAKGAIVTGANTGLYYQWAESGAGGESLIPHRRNQRSIDLWNETGRILGVGRGGGGSAVNINVDSGAVQVKVAVAGTSASPKQIQDAATSAVQKGMDGLLTKIRAGAGGRK